MLISAQVVTSDPFFPDATPGTSKLGGGRMLMREYLKECKLTIKEGTTLAVGISNPLHGHVNYGAGPRGKQASLKSHIYNFGWSPRRPTLGDESCSRPRAPRVGAIRSLFDVCARR